MPAPKTDAMGSDAKKIERYLGRALHGSLIAQRAARLDIPASGLTNRQIERISDDIREFGLKPELLSENALSALFVLFMEERNARELINHFTTVLWNILGNPETGGTSPPEVYRRAGIACHLLLLCIFDPDFADEYGLHD